MCTDSDRPFVCAVTVLKANLGPSRVQGSLHVYKKRQSSCIQKKAVFMYTTKGSLRVYKKK